MAIKRKTRVQVLREFGLVMALVLFLFAGYALFRERAWGFYVAFIGGLFLITGLFYPQSLDRAEIIWMKFGEKIGSVMTVVVLSLMFYLVFAPYGFLVKLFGKDLLEKQIDSKRNSYWIPIDDTKGPGGRPQKPF